MSGRPFPDGEIAYHLSREPEPVQVPVVGFGEREGSHIALLREYRE
jgi:hypothetical protein